RQRRTRPPAHPFFTTIWYCAVDCHLEQYIYIKENPPPPHPYRVVVLTDHDIIFFTANVSIHITYMAANFYIRTDRLIDERIGSPATPPPPPKRDVKPR